MQYIVYSISCLSLLFLSILHRVNVLHDKRGQYFLTESLSTFFVLTTYADSIKRQILDNVFIYGCSGREIAGFARIT